jgi:hypothetical protein
MRHCLLVLAAAACGGTSTPATRTVEHHAEPAATTRDTPAPSIAWADGKPAITGLPAVAKGGEIVVVPISGGDAGRGYPNLRIEVHDRSDKTIQAIDVLTSNEFESLAPGGAASPALQKRIADANAELARLHGVHDLTPMHPLEIQDPSDGGTKHLAIGDSLDVDWNIDHLHVLHHNTDNAVVVLDGKPWLVKDHKPCPTCPPCENPAFLDGVYHAIGINVLVVQIGYRGTDTCWEPADQMHIVTW